VPEVVKCRPPMNFGGNAQSKLLGVALKSGLANGAADSSNTFLFCIPIQVGPASPYARNVRHWFHAILIMQAVVCAARLLILGDFLGGLWMALLCALGWYAWNQDMNITYICLWGLGCLVNGIFDMLSIIIPIVFNILTLAVIDIFLRALVPASELLGAAFSWHLYLDYFNSGGGSKDNSFMNSLAGSMPDPMGKLVDEVDPEEYRSLVAGVSKQGEQFQKSLESGHVTKQVRKGAAAMQQGAEQLAEQLQQQQPPPPLPPQSNNPVLRSSKQAPCC